MPRVERREASTLRYWVLDASLGVQAVPVWHGQGAGASRTERLPALYPLVFEGTKKEAHPARFEAASLSRAGGALSLLRTTEPPPSRMNLKRSAARRFPQWRPVT